MNAIFTPSGEPKIAPGALVAPLQSLRRRPMSRGVLSSMACRVLVGFLIAVAIMELVSRQLSSGFIRTPLPTSAFRVNPNALTPSIAYYQCSEGCTTSHFTGDGSRVTGNPRLNSVPTGVIVGDSFAEAAQVADSETTGSVVERISRSNECPINVREYGWGNASVPVYVAIGPTILDRLNPKWVVVLLNRTDTGKHGLESEAYWRAKINSRGDLDIREVADSDRLATSAGVAPGAIRFARSLMARSRFFFLCVKQTQEIVRSQREVNDTSQTESNEDVDDTYAEVQALKRVYSDRLLVVYIPQEPVGSVWEPTRLESALLSACEREQVECLSMGPTMVRDADEGHTTSTGFDNTAPGTGHLNAHGHKLLAHLIWSAIAKKRPNAIRPR